MAKVNIKSVEKFVEKIDISGGKVPNDTIIKISEAVKIRFEEIIREELRQIVSNTTGIGYLNDFLLSKISTEGKNKFLFTMNFDDRVYRKSLGGKDVYMPYIVNNMWSYNGLRYWGKDRHGNPVRTVLKWPYRNQKGFMKRAVDKFNAEHAGSATATLNAKYDK